MKKFHLNIYIALLIRFVLALLLFTLCRVFFQLINADHYQNISIANIYYGGVIFDIAGLLYLLTPYIFTQLIPLKVTTHKRYQKISNWLYVLPLSVGLFANIADSMYFHVTLKRSTFTLFSQFANESNLGALFFHFLGEYWYAFLVFVVLVGIIIIINKLIVVKPVFENNNLAYYATSLGALVIVGLFVLIGIRGDYKYSSRPITLSNASNYISKPNQRALVLNTPFTIIRTINEEGLEEQNYFPKLEQEAIYSALHNFTFPEQSFTKKNVVLLILESFGREHIGALNKHIPNYKGFTPFIDSLITHSQSFKYAFANGQKSICGMTSNIASIPTLQTPFVLSHYSGNNINSMASLLKHEGYQTAFFHGAPNGSMGFDAFAKQAGFDNYFGMNEYNNDKDFDGYWGIWDEEFFGYYANQMNQMQEPFFTALFSVSSHHPFHVPTRYEGVFPEGKLPIQKTIGYTDFALKQFFNQAKKMDWFNNTIFILTADHASTYNNNSIKEYKSPSGVFSVPIIIYEPGADSLANLDENNVVQQIDILPTILNRLNYSNPYIAFGKDMFNNRVTHFAVNYESGNYLLFKDEFLLRYDGETIEGLYNYRTDPHLFENLVDSKQQVKNELLELLQAFIQEHNYRMIHNEMSFDKQ